MITISGLRLKSAAVVMMFAAGLAVSACAGTPPTATPTETPLPAIFLATPRPTDIPERGPGEEIVMTGSPPTAQPTWTPEPTLTPTPDVPLSADGPWLIFMASTEAMRGDGQLWVTNADGSGLTNLVNEEVLAFKVQPGANASNVLIAVVTQSATDERDIELKMLHLPGGEIQPIAKLINDREGQPPLSPYDAAEAVRGGGLAWSPDGGRLAFVAQIDGPTMDGYVYNTFDASIIRLTSGDTQAMGLKWSPNGAWVIHGGFAFQGMGGPETDAIWAAHSNGAGSVTLADREADDYSGYMYTGWWEDSSHLLLVDYANGEESSIRLVNVTDGISRTILQSKFGDFAYSPEHDVWLLTPDCCDDTATFRFFSNGTFVDLAISQDQIGYSGLAYIWWDADYDSFYGMTGDGRLFAISVTGELTDTGIGAKGRPTYPFIIESPDKTLWAWHDYGFYDSASNLSIGEPMTDPRLIASSEDLANGQSVDSRAKWIIRSIIWSQDSQRLMMISSRGLWKAERPDFTPVLVNDRVFMMHSEGWGSQWVPSK